MEPITLFEDKILDGRLRGLELRRMQMITEVGAEQNSMTIIVMSSEIVRIAKGLAVGRRRRQTAPIVGCCNTAARRQTHRLR